MHFVVTITSLLVVVIYCILNIQVVCVEYTYNLNYSTIATHPIFTKHTRCSPKVMHTFYCDCTRVAAATTLVGEEAVDLGLETATSQSPGASAFKLKCSFCK